MSSNSESLPPRESTRALQSSDSEASKKRKQSFLENMYIQGEKSGLITVADELRRIYDTDPDRLDVYIDDVVYQTLKSDPEFITNIDRLSTLASYGKLRGADIQEDAQIRARQNALFNEYKQNLIELSGLPSEVGDDEYEVSQAKVKKIISEQASEKDSNNLLEALGILTRDENDKEIFTYPRDLMPAETNKKWELYLDRVVNQIRVNRGTLAGTRSHQELEDAEDMRTVAHDSVSRDIDRVLGFDQLDGVLWDFKRTRGLVAKMRDSKFPNVETAEKARTTDATIRAAHTLGILGTKVSQLK